MFPRQYWGRAGGALVSIAIASALADVIARSVSGTPKVPLWPLGICALVFLAGVVLFALRASSDAEQPHASPLPPGDPISSPASDDGPEHLARFFEGNTDLQARQLIEAHFGPRIRVTGHLENIEHNEYEDTADVTFLEYPGGECPRLKAKFHDKAVIAGRLAQLKPNTRMTVDGTIGVASRYFISLDDCEIVSLALPDTDTPKASAG